MVGLRQAGPRKGRSNPKLVSRLLIGSQVFAPYVLATWAWSASVGGRHDSASKAPHYISFGIVWLRLWGTVVVLKRLSQNVRNYTVL